MTVATHCSRRVNPLQHDSAPVVLGFNYEVHNHQPTNSTIPQGMFQHGWTFIGVFGQIRNVYAHIHYNTIWSDVGNNLGTVCFWLPYTLCAAPIVVGLCVVSLLPCVADCCMLYTMRKVERFVLTIIKRRSLSLFIIKIVHKVQIWHHTSRHTNGVNSIGNISLR